MSSPALCPTCGSPVLAEAVAGQCPHCLIQMARAADDGPSASDFDSAHRQFGSYVLGRQVGAGGMGVVYEAHRLTDGRRVALKLIREFHLVSPTQVRRFTIEAEAIARLDHPHIVRIHEAGECDGQPFLCMDFIDGEGLGTRVAMARGGASGQAPAPTVTAQLMAKVARAVHHAHTRGVLHRDLKPGNILIDSQGEPRLTDFGLAKILERNAVGEEHPTLTSAGDAPGTPSYMAPEQVARGEVGCASDVYGLGAVLYALLTGQPPFQGATPLDVFRQITAQAPVRPRALNPRVSSALETICLKCLEKDPRHRYSTAEALAEDLEAFARGQAIKARSAGPVHRARQWVRRNPLGAALIASLCLGLAVAIVLLKVVNDQRRAVELDRDEAFEEGMHKISLIWQEPETKAVTISARELAVLAGRSPAGLARAEHQLTLGVRANDRPASMAQRYAHLVGGLQTQMARELHGTVAFHLRLMKRFYPNDEALTRGEADFIVLSAVEFLRAERAAPGIVPVARANTSRDGVIFARAQPGLGRLTDLRGRSMAFPDPDHSLTVWAKARLVEAGIRASDLRNCVNIEDRDAAAGPATVSLSETMDRVLRGQVDAGVAHRSSFDRYRHLGLVVLDQFPETPHVLAARAGLEPKLIEALAKAIRALEGSTAWPESKFVVDARAEDGSAAVPGLEKFREAVRLAGEFEDQTRR